MDLERVLLTVFVIILHLNNRDMGGALNLVNTGTAAEIMIRFFESASICAVDAFLMLSGYFAAVRHPKSDYASGSVSPNGNRSDSGIPVRKSVLLLLTCSFYRVTGYICYIIFITPGDFNIRTFIGYMLPNNWYVCLFVTVLLLSPFINRLLSALNDRERSILTGLSLFLFSAVPMFVTMMGEIEGVDIRGLSTVTWQGDGMGFNAAVFVTCYIVGYSIRCSRDYWDRFGVSFYLVMYFLTSALTAAVSRFTESVWHYSDLLVIMEAAMLTLAFTRVSVRSDRIGKVISALAGCSLGIFLWHTMPVMFAGFWVRFGIAASAEKGFAAFALTCTGAAAAMYAVSGAWVLACRYIIRTVTGALHR